MGISSSRVHCVSQLQKELTETENSHAEADENDRLGRHRGYRSPGLIETKLANARQEFWNECPASSAMRLTESVLKLLGDSLSPGGTPGFWYTRGLTHTDGGTLVDSKR